MKAVITLGLAFLLLFSVAGCGGEDAFAKCETLLSDCKSIEDLVSTYSEVTSLLVGKAESVIDTERWNKGINNENYHTSGLIVDGIPYTVTLTVKDKKVASVTYTISDVSDMHFEQISAAAADAFGEPDNTYDTDSGVNLSWGETMLLYLRDAHVCTIS